MLANPMSAFRSMLWGLLLLCALTLASCRAASDALTPALVERNNRAVGLMGQFDFNAAVDAFAAIQTSAPDWPEGRLNLAMALMNRQGDGDAARAEALLRESLERRRSRAVPATRSDCCWRTTDGSAEALPLSPRWPLTIRRMLRRLLRRTTPACRRTRRGPRVVPPGRNRYSPCSVARTTAGSSRLRRLNRDEEATAMLARFQALNATRRP